MIYSLDLYIKTTGQTLIDRIESSLPPITDEKIDSRYYDLKQIVDQFDGLPVLAGMIRFNLDNDRQDFFNDIMALDGIFTDCEIGSLIKFHDCNLPNEDKTDRQCFDEIVFEVTP